MAQGECVREADWAIVYQDDLEEEISQSDAEPVMTMNIPVRNGDDVTEPVFAVVLVSARNSFDGTSGMIAARDEFMEVNVRRCRTRMVACPAA